MRRCVNTSTRRHIDALSNGRRGIVDSAGAGWWLFVVDRSSDGARQREFAAERAKGP
jgi:hypothetical protein